MDKNILYFSDLCPDTPAFVATLEALQIKYEAVNITQSMGALKAFLRLRDQESAFAEIKNLGRIGIPVLHHISGAIIFEIEQLKRLA